jgi:glutamate:Na+ symporter, ESS family
MKLLHRLWCKADGGVAERTQGCNCACHPRGRCHKGADPLAPMLSLSPWWLLLLAWPVLWAGETIIRRFPVLARFNVPVPVVGGLAFATAVLLVGLLAPGARVTWESKVAAGGWTWLVTPDSVWSARPPKSFNLPLLVGFFTCIGLLAPLEVLRRGGRPLVILLGGATVLAVLQNAVGVAVAAALHAPPLLGVICGALTLVGGHGTALGFASRFEEAGIAGAATMGAAAATFGLVAGGLIAGPVAEWLLRRGQLAPAPDPRSSPRGEPLRVASFRRDVRALAGCGSAAVSHLLIVAGCVKAGAWLSYALERGGASLPAYMGALLVGLAVRAAHDAAGGSWLRPEVLQRISTVLLALFLAVTLAALNLADLAAVAGPMFVILVVNLGVTVVFAVAVIWPLLGRSYEGAVMVAGLLGFTIGSTATAVAAMDAMVGGRRAAPQAFALVPPTGGFLIDLTNAPVIAAFLRALR